MSSRLLNHRDDEESLIALSPINERVSADFKENAKVSSTIEMADASIPAQANIKNRKTDEVSLIDISYNKKWICYISHLRNQSTTQGGSQYVLDRDNKKITYITRHRLIEENTDQDELFEKSKSNGQNSPNTSMQQQASTNITQYTSNSTKNYCTFLTISPDGQYAVLSLFYKVRQFADSFTEETDTTNGINCTHIFKVDDNNNFQHFYTWRLSFRPVFIDTGKDDRLCLALINTKMIAIFNDFSENTDFGRYFSFYSLAPFHYIRALDDCMAYHTSFIEDTATWVNMNNTENKSNEFNYEMLTVITLSRHIRDNRIVTPFVSGTVRAWSIADNGIRLMSFFAPNEHIIAFSKDDKYVVTFTDGVRTIKIYNVKSGLLIYNLKSTQPNENNTRFNISHATFCFESRYLALSLVITKRDSNNKPISSDVVFEVWYIEAEKLIYSKTERTGVNITFGYTSTKVVKPFVTEITTKDNDNYLKGVFTYFTENDESEIKYFKLDIDGDDLSNNNMVVEADSSTSSTKNNVTEDTDSNIDNTADQKIKFEWIESDTNIPDLEYHEIANELDDYNGMRCGNIYLGDKKKYLARFGRHMIQLWRLGNSSGEAKKDDELVYIRAYKRPDRYRHVSPIDSGWEVDSYESIKFVGEVSKGRMLVNIKATAVYYNSYEDYFGTSYPISSTNEGILGEAYYTEEIFLPISSSTNKVDYHTLESTCQALQHLHNAAAIYQVNLTEGKNIKKSVDVENLQFRDYVKTYLPTDYEGESEYRKNTKEQLKKNLQQLFKKTLNIINIAIDQIEDDSLNFFSTVAGSKALCLLASFGTGREIIKKILKNEAIPFGIFSVGAITNSTMEDWKQQQRKIKKENSVYYKSVIHDNQKTTTYRRSITPPQIDPVSILSSSVFDLNLMTVLLTMLCYDLFELVFNRVLSDSKKIGPGCLSALTDALIYLQKEKNTVFVELFSRCSQKLLYLEVSETQSDILPSELRYLQYSVLQEEVSVSDIRYWASCCMIEQITKFKIRQFYKYQIELDMSYIKSEELARGPDGVKKLLDSSTQSTSMYWRRYYILKIYAMLFLLKPKNTSVIARSRICVVPFPYINTYDVLSFRLAHHDAGLKKQGDQQLLYKNTSWFVDLASDNSKSNIFRQGDTVLEIMLQYKWKTFIRKRFIGVCLIHVIYYVSYCTGVLFANEMYGYDSANEGRSLAANNRHIASLVIMFLSGFTLFFQEIRQIYYSRKKMDYFRSWFNYVDLLAFIFPLVTFFQMVFNGNYFHEICSVSTLILWMHGVLRLRAISFIGVAVETIIQLIEKVAPILSVWLIVVLAFTNSFIVLLRQQPDDYFQENYNGTISIPNGENAENVGVTNTYDISSSNGFIDPFKAFYQVWLIIFGVWDPIINGNAGDDRMLFVLCILFALITVLIFTNMVIALMSSTVDEVKRRGKSVWVGHFAAVVAEIEQIWCGSSTKHNRQNNPSHIYYAASFEEVEKHKEMLKINTEKLRKKLFGAV